MTLFGFDFGAMIPTASSFSDWLVLNLDVDFGSILVPNATNVDQGALV